MKLAVRKGMKKEGEISIIQCLLSIINQSSQ